MARIAGVNIPTNKRVEIALTYIHGARPRLRFAGSEQIDEDVVRLTYVPV